MPNWPAKELQVHFGDGVGAISDRSSPYRPPPDGPTPKGSAYPGTATAPRVAREHTDRIALRQQTFDWPIQKISPYKSRNKINGFYSGNFPN